MTLEEYQVWGQSIIADIASEHKRLLNGCDLETTKSIYDKYRFLFKRHYAVLNLAHLEFEELQETIDTFNKEIEKHKSKFMFEVGEHTNISCDDDSPFVHECGFMAEWYEVVDSVSIRFIEQAIVEKLSRQLNPNANGYFTRTINCKVFELFKTGQIDFATMQLLTYDKCSL